MKRNLNDTSSSTTAVGIIFQLADGTIQSCNPDAEKILGYGAAQLLGVDPFEPPWQTIHQDGTLFPPETHPAIASIKTGQPCADVVMGFYQPNGDLVWLSINSLPLFKADQIEPYGVVVNFTDITPQQTSSTQEPANPWKINLLEAKSILQSAIANTTDIVFIKNLQGKYVIANQAAANFLGITIEEILGQDDFALFDLETAQLIITLDQQVMTAGKPFSYEENLVNSKTQSILLTSKYPWRDNEGNVCGIIGVSRDITAFKQSQQQLKENEQVLRLALSSFHAGSWDWNIARGKLIWSPENYALYGLDPQIGSPKYQDWENRLHPEDRQWIVEEIQLILSGQLAQFDGEFRIVHPQRGVRWIWGLASATLNEQNQIVRLSGINIDITERQKLIEQVRRSEQHLRKVLDSLLTFVGVLNPDGTLIEANRPALEAANLQPEDVLGKPFAQTYWWSYSSQTQAQLNHAIRRAAGGEAVRYDIKARLSAVSYILIDFTLVPLFDANGQVEYLIPSGIDITEREASKQALQQSKDDLKLITEVIPHQIWTALPNGEIDYFNQRWQNYTGVVDAELLQKHGWEFIVHPDDLQRLRKTWAESIHSGKKYDVEARLTKADGTYHWFLIKARPLRNEQGEIIKWYGTNTSITRIKDLEETLRQQTEDLIQANQLKDEFLAIVSHELRTPLNPILGWSQLLLAGRLDAEKIAMGIQIIERNAKLQTQLIDDLLDVSRILRGQLNLKKDSLDLEFVVSSALISVQLAAEAKSIQIETVFEPNLEILGDAGRLQQVVGNLVSNAIKFTPEGGRVTVTLERVGQYAQIQVKDTGQGINEEFLPYVFERFRQAQSSSSRKFGGLGLGLAIVHHLAELHDGTVTAASPGEGQGATFSVRLPLINTLVAKPSDRVPTDVSVKPERFNGMRILVIDDDLDSLDLLTLFLEQQGAEVRSLNSANAAMAAIGESTPDLIISDIGMPEVDGYTMMTQIRELPQGQNIPAIALTAYAGEVDRLRSIEVGFQKHLAKPIDLTSLITMIGQLMHSNDFLSR